MQCLSRSVFVTGCGFHIPRPSLACILADIRATEILLDIDREKTAPEASLQQSLHSLYWALTYIQHIRLKSTQPLRVALPSQEGSRWREDGGGKEEGV